ncbi:LuxR C-terminal-related transcriptional regulator [Kitasatospora sp. NPDC006786]|uniref:LuxR C-terminal-related transcriptional regulator n=1 Tax=unclassified Kitasatospora TaxID=2633591 RepID=UPI00340A7256
MTASRTDARPLPKVHEPLILRCGHHITEEITGPEALALIHLVTDLNAIEIAAAVNAVPERQDATGTTTGTTGTTGTTAEAVREHLNSLKRRLRARTWTQMVDTACRMRLLLPPRAVLTTPLPETAVPTLQLLADGYTNQQIAVMRTVSPGCVGSHLEAIRHRMRTRGTPAAVYRLHGVVPAVLDATCQICATGDEA